MAGPVLLGSTDTSVAQQDARCMVLYAAPFTHSSVLHVLSMTVDFFSCFANWQVQ